MDLPRVRSKVVLPQPLDDDSGDGGDDDGGGGNGGATTCRGRRRARWSCHTHLDQAGRTRSLLPLSLRDRRGSEDFFSHKKHFSLSDENLFVSIAENCLVHLQRCHLVKCYQVVTIM